MARTPWRFWNHTQLFCIATIFRQAYTDTMSLFVDLLVFFCSGAACKFSDGLLPPGRAPDDFWPASPWTTILQHQLLHIDHFLPSAALPFIAQLTHDIPSLLSSVTAQCFLIASCEILNLNNGGPRMGGYGLFFVDVPELESEQCIKTMEIDEIFGRWGGDFAWEPREDDVRALNCCWYSFIGFMNLWQIPNTFVTPNSSLLQLLVAAQIGSGVAVAFGFISLVTVFCKSCCCPLPCSQLLTDISGLAIQAGLAMVYLLWISDGCKFYDCEYGQGLSFLIAAQALWAISSCLSRCMRPSAAERKKIEIEQEEAAR